MYIMQNIAIQITCMKFGKILCRIFFFTYCIVSLEYWFLDILCKMCYHDCRKLFKTMLSFSV